MSNTRHILVFGFALFVMFFGSGNLVFPIQIGANSSSSWLIGFFGLFITGIILPFLGLFVVKQRRGNYNQFFGEAGVFAKIALPFFVLSLLGSFGVVPRCISVAYGGFHSVAPELNSYLFSLIFSLLIFLLCLGDQKMVNILGKLLSPILFGALIYIIVCGIFSHENIEMIDYKFNYEIFYNGFLTGYQTMDLFAAFCFSSLIFAQANKIFGGTYGEDQIIKFSVLSSIIGALLLSIIYMGLVFLGAKYSNILENISPELGLFVIAEAIIGKNASLIVCGIIFLSCLTTAVALSNIYAQYICSILGLKKTYFPLILFITIASSCIISLSNFRGIASFLVPILEVSYPSIIALTILSIFSKKMPKVKFVIFYGILAFMLAEKLI